MIRNRFKGMQDDMFSCKAVSMSTEKYTADVSCALKGGVTSLA